MADPIITVAIPTYNGGGHLRQALGGILSQSEPFDLWIVDDRSEDETLTIARDLAGDRARIAVNSERLGLARNWNQCVAHATTPVVALFHQDDVMLPGHLASHLAAYAANPDLGWVATDADVIDEAGRPVPESVVERGGLGDQDRDLDHGQGVEALAVANPLRCSAVTINRAAHSEVGGFNPLYQYVVDWDYWVRVANVRPVAWRATTTAAIRWHLASETHRFAAGLVDLNETVALLGWIDRHLDIYTRTYPEWRRLADNRLARAYLNRAHVAFKQGDPRLSRQALVQALRLAPRRVLGTLAGDPRLVAQLGLAWLTPGSKPRDGRAD